MLFYKRHLKVSTSSDHPCRLVFIGTQWHTEWQPKSFLSIGYRLSQIKIYMKYSEPNYGLHLSHAQPYCALYKFYKYDKHFFEFVSTGEQKVHGLCSKRNLQETRLAVCKIQTSQVRQLGTQIRDGCWIFEFPQKLSWLLEMSLS